MSVDRVARALVFGGLVAGALGPNWLFVLAGLGMFGPYLLREAGLAAWRDDFHRETTMRAGMHALVAVGVLLTVVMTMSEPGESFRSHQPFPRDDAVPAFTVFLVLAMTWGVSGLIQFWGVPQGSYRIILTTVTVWTVISIGTLLFLWLAGRPQSWHGIWQGLLQLGWGWILVLSIRRWPRPVSVLLLGTVALISRFMWTFSRVMDLDAYLVLDLLILLCIPLVVPALALLNHRREPEEVSA